MAEMTMRRCGRCRRVLRSAEAVEVGFGSYCCKQALGKTLKQVLKERCEKKQGEGQPGGTSGDAAE